MENQEKKENTFKEKFSGYEQDPPERVWENLEKELKKEPGQGNVQGISGGFLTFTKSQLRILILSVTLIVILFLAVVYFTSNDNHAIRGHAYTGETRLCRGTAVLFVVPDKSSPLDSVYYYRSAMIDENGYYQFKKVRPGKYLLRIAPPENSEDAKRFLPTWFDHSSEPGGSNIIVISDDEVNADVHLLIKSEVAR
jgi:hypothetical protein